MNANKFVLKHDSLEVDYVIGATPGIPPLTYRRGAETKTFGSADITTNDTGLGTLVSVTLIRSVDTGGERFGFFLPTVDLALNDSLNFTTIGVYEKFSGPDSRPDLPPSWRCTTLNGTAEAVILPLVEASS